MPNIKYRKSSTFLAFKYSFIISCIFQHVSATEITEIDRIPNFSMEIKIDLPVLMCHAKYTGYKQVKWFKDYELLRTGSSDIASHKLSLDELLSESPERFKHAGELQGYYWCETDYTGPTAVFNYLFRISEIHTFVGWFASTEDSLESRVGNLTLQRKLDIKKDIYEQEMDEDLFGGFLQKARTHVTAINILQKGLQVRFYLYVPPLLTNIDPRKPVLQKLEEDEHELRYIIEYLNNESEAVDPSIYEILKDWLNFRGIHAKAITIRSTLGCYQDVTLIPGEPPQETTWPKAYIDDVVIPNENCYSKTGLAVTRLCSGTFYTGAKWGSPSVKCDMPANKLTVQLKDLYQKFGDDTKIVYIQKLQQLTKDSTLLTVTDLHIVADIITRLSEVKELNLKEVRGLFSIFDNIVETNSSEMVAAKNTIKLTSRLLKAIDNILDLESVNEKEVLISKKHFLVDSTDTRIAGNIKDHIHGVAVLPRSKEKTLINGSLEFLTSDMSVPKQDSLAFFVIPEDLIIMRENQTILPNKNKVNVVFFDQWLLFQNPKGVLHKRNYKVLPTPVIYISVSGGPAWNLEKPVQISFKDTFNRKIENPVCVYYDPRLDSGQGDWSTEGCEYGGLKNGFHQCQCHHLSIFAVILSENPDSRTNSFHLGTAIYVGCGVSIIALSMTVLLHLLSKVWRATVDHGVLFGMALSLLCGLILLFISEMEFLWKPGCLLMAMLLHYTILVTVGWLLVQAIVHRLRFAKKTDIEEIPHFILKSALATWGLPIIIIGIIWLAKDYNYYKQHSCWRTVTDVSNIALIPIVTLLLIILCVNLCALYAVTCSFKKDFLIADSIYNDSVVKFRIANSIYLFYVLSWLFGFFALHNKTKELRILFSISITLTSYYLALFFIFHEVSLWELCSKWRNSDKPEDDTVVTFVAKSTKADQKSFGSVP